MAYQSTMEMSTRVPLESAVLNVSRIRRNDPGCRGETLSVSELTLVTKSGAACTSRDRLTA
jgi:hypothetical protein